MKRELLIGLILVAVIIGIIFFVYNPSPSPQFVYACDLSTEDIKNISCSSDSDCALVEGPCDTSTSLCIPKDPNNVNLDLYPDNEEDCERVGGRWTKVFFQSG